MSWVNHSLPLVLRFLLHCSLVPKLSTSHLTSLTFRVLLMGWTVALRKLCPGANSWSLNVSSFGNGHFADVIKIFKMRRSSLISQVHPKSNDNCPYERNTEIWDTWAGTVTVECRFEVIWPQVWNANSHQRSMALWGFILLGTGCELGGNIVPLFLTTYFVTLCYGSLKSHMAFIYSIAAMGSTSLLLQF